MIAIVGTIGFKNKTYYVPEGNGFCVPIYRVNGTDENIYLTYFCEPGCNDMFTFTMCIFFYLH